MQLERLMADQILEGLPTPLRLEGTYQDETYTKQDIRHLADAIREIRMELKKMGLSFYVRLPGDED